MFPPDTLQQPRAGIFHQVGDFLKPASASIVGVGDPRGLVLQAKLHQKADFPGVLAGGIQRADIGEVFFVGDQDEVEPLQIGGSDPPRAAFDFVAAGFQDGGHPGVGRIAGVVADGAGGVDLDAAGQSGVVCELAENDLRGGRTADVAHANEKDPERFGHGADGREA